MGTMPPQMPPQVPQPPDPFKTQYPQFEPERRRGLPTWGIVAIIAVVLILGGCGMMVYFFTSALGLSPGSMFSGGSPFSPPAKVHLGTQLAWRKLEPDSNGPFGMREMSYIDLAAGDLDGDGADEVLVGSAFHDTTLFELDGTKTEYTWMINGMPVLQTWDFDGDGTAEIVSQDYSGSGSYCDFRDLNDTVVGQLNGEVGYENATLADVDADGVLDIVMTQGSQYDAGSLTVYGQTGNPLWSFKTSTNQYNPAFGDVDGDGAAEIVFADQVQYLEAYEMDGSCTKLPGWNDYFWPTACLDVDGDGVDEVFASNHGYQNVVTGVYTQLDYSITGTSASSDPMEMVYFADVDRDGTPELITRGIDNFSMNSGLFFFDTAGNCTYYEEMGHPIKRFCVLKDANGDDFLLVHTESDLLIYP